MKKFIFLFLVIIVCNYISAQPINAKFYSTTPVSISGESFRNISSGIMLSVPGSISNKGIVKANNNEWLTPPVSTAISSLVSNIPPIVSIITPVNNQMIYGPVNLQLRAAASDPDGTITKVEFYKGTSLLHTERYPGYSWEWRNVPVDDYIITAKAYDNSGAVSVSAPIKISIAPLPPSTLSITDPIDNAIYTSPANIRVNAIASKTGSPVRKVEFYDGTKLIATERYLAYTWKWRNVPIGKHTITAKAFYYFGRTITSAPVHITVTGKGHCSFNDQPTFGYNFNGTSVANINNGISDLGEAANVTVCDGGHYTTSGYFNSNSSDLYKVTLLTSGGKLIIGGNLYLDGTGVLTSPQFLGSAGTYTIALQNPAIGGTVIQTLTPFTDLNNNGMLDGSDCTGEPIVFTYTATSKPTWYKDADGDHHASATTHSCASPGAGWTMNQLPVDDCNDNDAAYSSPTFGYNFNGTPVANINNGISDPGEAASITVCDGGQVNTSGYFNSNPSDLYKVTILTSGGKLIIGGNLYLDGTGVLTGPQFLGSAGTYTIALQSPALGGTVIQTLTPFTDLNNNGVLDAGDCTGEPIVFTYTATSKPTWYKDADGDHHASATTHSCASPGAGWTMNQLPVDDCNDNDAAYSSPTFGYNFNGTPVANINNGISDPGEAASITVCDGGQVNTSGYFNSNPSDLYKVTILTSGGKLIIGGNLYLDGTGVLTGPQFLGSAGTYTIALQNPAIGGTVIQTLTPFTDLNNNGVLDGSDCTGEPIVFTYTATPCDQNKALVSRIKNADNKVANLNGSMNFKLSPNPANNILNIYTTGLQKNKQVALSVISASGVTMKTKNLNGLNTTIQLNISSLVSGTYTLKLISGDNIIYKKFVKL